MKVYVFRHALADFSKKSADPSNPPLTAEGRSQVEKVTSLGRKLGFKPGLIVSSPLLRAKETAEITKNELPKGPQILVDECLYGDRRPEVVYKFLRKRKINQVVLVSHQPLIDRLMTDLLGGKSKIHFINGAIACVEISSKLEKGRGELSWFLPPPD